MPESDRLGRQPYSRMATLSDGSLSDDPLLGHAGRVVGRVVPVGLIRGAIPRKRFERQTSICVPTSMTWDTGRWK